MPAGRGHTTNQPTKSLSGSDRCYTKNKAGSRRSEGGVVSEVRGQGRTSQREHLG